MPTKQDQLLIRLIVASGVIAVLLALSGPRLVQALPGRSTPPVPIAPQDDDDDGGPHPGAHIEIKLAPGLSDTWSWIE